MKPDRCQATAASGKPCSATPRPGRPFCLWHDPAADEERRELSRKGGRGRSNRSRAAKQLPDSVMTIDQVRGYIGLSLKAVLAGRISPGVANAVASLSRAFVVATEASEIEERLSELERAAGIDGRKIA